MEKIASTQENKPFRYPSRLECFFSPSKSQEPSHTPLNEKQAIDLQRTVIQGQSSQPELPPEFFKLYEQNISLVGRKQIPIPGSLGGEYYLVGKPNDILIIQKRKKKKNFLLFFSKKEIETYYFIDKKNNKSWEMGQLFRHTGKQRPKLINLPVFRNAGATALKTGDVIILNDFSDFGKPKGLMKELRLSQDDVDILDLIIPFHEAAHVLQGIKESGNSSLESSFIKDQLIRKLVLPVVNFILSVIGPSKKMYELKKKMTWSERNAHAFELGLIRKLKQQGVDIFRGHDAASISAAIDKALISYDINIGKRLPGRPFSQRLRKLMRKQEQKA